MLIIPQSCKCQVKSWEQLDFLVIVVIQSLVCVWTAFAENRELPAYIHILRCWISVLEVERDRDNILGSWILSMHTSGLFFNYQIPKFSEQCLETSSLCLPICNSKTSNSSALFGAFSQEAVWNLGRAYFLWATNESGSRFYCF